MLLLHDLGNGLAQYIAAHDANIGPVDIVTAAGLSIRRCGDCIRLSWMSLLFRVLLLGRRGRRGRHGLLLPVDGDDAAADSNGGLARVPAHSAAVGAQLGFSRFRSRRGIRGATGTVRRPRPLLPLVGWKSGLVGAAFAFLLCRARILRKIKRFLYPIIFSLLRESTPNLG